MPVSMSTTSFSSRSEAAVTSRERASRAVASRCAEMATISAAKAATTMNARATLASHIRRARVTRELLDRAAQLVGVERLRDEAIGSCDPCIELGVAPGRDHDHEHVLQVLVVADCLQHLDPAEARKHDIEDDQVGVELPRGDERLGSVRGLDEAVARPEHGSDELPQARVVVADENRRGVRVGCGLKCWSTVCGRGGGRRDCQSY